MDNNTSDVITLSTMTLDGSITNVKFDKVKAIDYLEITDRVVEIGCNFGHKISESYKLMECYKDRITKKKKRGKLKSSRSQGLGTHFNSQITFTIITDLDTKNSYQIKLFTNGTIQIPGIGKLSKNNDELLEDILSVIISYIKLYPDVLMLNSKKDVEIIHLTPILQNFKSITLLSDDCMKEIKTIEDNNKTYQIPPAIELYAFENAIIRLSLIKRPPFNIDNMIFNPERYSGMLIKFSTPIIITNNYKLDKFIEMVKLFYRKKSKRSRIFKPSYNDSDDKMTRIIKMIQMKWYENLKGSKKYRKKLTTVKLFRSGKINIDHVNNIEQAEKIRNYIVELIMDSWDSIIYYPD